MSTGAFATKHTAGSVLARGHDGAVIEMGELLSAVDVAFSFTGRGMAPWPDPHDDRSPGDEEYSRLTDPAKWRIIGARADAWITALVDAGLADRRGDASVRWSTPPRTTISHAYRVVPHDAGALSLVVARSEIGTVDDAGVTLGAGDPAVVVGWIPECGCDACDHGSQDVLGHLDEQLISVVSGAFRRLVSQDREITVSGEGRWQSSGFFARGEESTIIDDPTGWDEVSGSSWLTDPGS